MNGKQKEFLAKSGINLTDGLVYFSENERLYEKYLFRFLEEPTFPELFKAIEEDRREDARRAAHSLKGITAGAHCSSSSARLYCRRPAVPSFHRKGTYQHCFRRQLRPYLSFPSRELMMKNNELLQKGTFEY